jgi:hypothetical protein
VSFSASASDVISVCDVRTFCDVRTLGGADIRLERASAASSVLRSDEAHNEMSVSDVLWVGGIEARLV